jgi:DNA-binding transcriptional LysR family regulator
MDSNLMRATRDPSGRLRIAAPMTFVASGLGALLASYRTLHPRIDFDVT